VNTLFGRIDIPTAYLAALAFGVLAAGVLGCPSHDETREPDGGPGPAEDETGQHAPPAPEPGPECAKPPCAEPE